MISVQNHRQRLNGNRDVRKDVILSLSKDSAVGEREPSMIYDFRFTRYDYRILPTASRTSLDLPSTNLRFTILDVRLSHDAYRMMPISYRLSQDLLAGSDLRSVNSGFPGSDAVGNANRKSYVVNRTYKYLLLAIALIIASCSPKTTVVQRPPEKKPEPVVVTPPKTEPAPVPAKKRVNNIALILPFQLDKITTKKIQARDVTRAAIALDFYQGFKYALDSLAMKGYDFKLQVLDSRDNNAQATALAKSAAVQQSDIIIGPVVPDGIKAFGAAADLRTKLQVSPLAAAMPAQFNNPRLVSLTNSIDQHARKLADFIVAKYSPAMLNVVISNARSAADEQFASPVRKYLSSQSKGRIAFAEITGLSGIEGKLVRGKTNVVIMTSFKSDFVASSLNVLAKLIEVGYNIELYGHPNWSKADNMDVEKLQMLNTRFTSSYFVDYDASEVKRFLAGYQAKYKQEPSEYAINGFDTGYLFGNMLAKYGTNYMKNMATERYTGLHTSFQFTFDQTTGYTNRNLMMLKFNDFELRPE